MTLSFLFIYNKVEKSQRIEAKVLTNGTLKVGVKYGEAVEIQAWDQRMSASPCSPTACRKMASSSPLAPF